MEMQPHIQAAKWHQYEIYGANSFCNLFGIMKKKDSGQLFKFVLKLGIL